MERDPILLTPGPLTTTTRTKQAMLRDWGSWDADFNRHHRRAARELLDDRPRRRTRTSCVPLQGSGTFSVEAAVGDLVPRDGHVLVPRTAPTASASAKICSTLHGPRARRSSTYAEDAAGPAR